MQNHSIEYFVNMHVHYDIKQRIVYFISVSVCAHCMLTTKYSDSFRNFVHKQGDFKFLRENIIEKLYIASRTHLYLA